MKDLATNKILDPTLGIMWQGHLPSAVRAVVAVTVISDLANLANIADKVMETMGPTHVSEVQAVSNTSDNQILAEIAKLSLRIRNLERDSYRFRNRSRGDPRSRSTSRGRNPSQRRSPESADWLCYYHYKFRDGAKKCMEPCAWKKINHQEN